MKNLSENGKSSQLKTITMYVYWSILNWGITDFLFKNWQANNQLTCFAKPRLADMTMYHKNECDCEVNVMW